MLKCSAKRGLEVFWVNSLHSTKKLLILVEMVYNHHLFNHLKGQTEIILFNRHDPGPTAWGKYKFGSSTSENGSLVVYWASEITVSV